jgi:hypothetical protein
MVAISTDDIGFAAEILRDDEMDMRLELDIEECDDRADATDEGEMDRGVERLSELDVLWAYDAIACVRTGGEERKGSRARKTRLYIHGTRSRQGLTRCRKRVPCGVTLVVLLG